MTFKLVHALRMPMRWGDMDAMGHVNNTVYFRYFEQARICWFEHIGCAPNRLGDGPVIVNAHCTFLRQLTYPGQIEVTTLVGPPGRSSFEMQHQIRLIGQDGEPGELHAEGGAKVVWVHFPVGKSTPLPELLQAVLPGPQIAPHA
jgi:acyl-CoA thioester hydrolase